MSPWFIGSVEVFLKQCHGGQASGIETCAHLPAHFPTHASASPCPRLLVLFLLLLLLLQRELSPTLLWHIPSHCYGIFPCHAHSVSAHSRYACLPTPTSLRTSDILVPLAARTRRWSLSNAAPTTFIDILLRSILATSPSSDRAHDILEDILPP